MVAAID